MITNQEWRQEVRKKVACLKVLSKAADGTGCLQESGRRELPANTEEFLQLRTESCRMSKNFGTRFVFILP